MIIKEAFAQSLIMTLDALILLICVVWTIMILFFLYNEYKINKRSNWFKYLDVVLGYVTHIIFQITIGTALWLSVFVNLPTSKFITFIILGILFFILSMGFRSIHSKRLKKRLEKTKAELKKLIKECREKYRENGSNSNNKN